ncbi:MAG: 2-oxoacid:acceptor oxidoreductase family protein [Clostridia bacterium]|nr:2-oxoacid:acceptor oxidoreductase family protein [Clostridia bacterium]
MKNGQMQLRLTGSGGQGVILASVILAEAAVMADKYTAQSQSYGPEARGGSCKAECIISDAPIAFTKVTVPTFLLALTQKALDTYAPGIPEGATVVIDESLSAPECLKNARVLALPILRTAKEKTGKAFTANIVAVGAINRLLKIVSAEAIEKAVLMHVPAGSESINMAALRAGEELVS